MISCFKGKFRLTSPRDDRVLNGVKGITTALTFGFRRHDGIYYP